jgi:hypothetical protein
MRKLDYRFEKVIRKKLLAHCLWQISSREIKNCERAVDLCDKSSAPCLFLPNYLISLTGIQDKHRLHSCSIQLFRNCTRSPSSYFEIAHVLHRLISKFGTYFEIRYLLRNNSQFRNKWVISKYKVISKYPGYFEIASLSEIRPYFEITHLLWNNRGASK